MNNILKIILIYILIIAGAIFLLFSPFSKKQINVEIPEIIVQPLQINPVSPFEAPTSTKNIKENINNIKSYTDLITDIIQKIFGTFSSGIGLYLLIKQIKDKKKK